MSKEIKSPTCGDCARRAGLRAVSPCLTVYTGTCANCGQEKNVSTSGDWAKPGDRIPFEAMD